MADTKYKIPSASYSALGAGTTRLSNAGIGMTNIQGRIEEIKTRMDLEQQKTKQRLMLIAEAGKLGSKLGEGLENRMLANKMAKALGSEESLSFLDAIFNPNKTIAGVPASVLATAGKTTEEMPESLDRMLEALKLVQSGNKSTLTSF